LVLPVQDDALKSKASQCAAPQLESAAHGIAQNSFPLASVTQQYGGPHEMTP
jgi:hypothetical protein